MKDLFGCIDVLAMKPGDGLLGLQVTSKTNKSSRRNKIMDSEEMYCWLQSGGRLELWSWYQDPPQPGGRWKVERIEFCIHKGHMGFRDVEQS